MLMDYFDVAIVKCYNIRVPGSVYYMYAVKVDKGYFVCTIDFDNNKCDLNHYELEFYGEYLDTICDRPVQDMNFGEIDKIILHIGQYMNKIRDLRREFLSDIGH